jgi:hypothetical protein
LVFLEGVIIGDIPGMKEFRGGGRVKCDAIKLSSSRKAEREPTKTGEMGLIPILMVHSYIVFVLTIVPDGIFTTLRMRMYCVLRMVFQRFSCH